MNIEQFEHAAAIAKTGSISIAAEQLHVSQAGISKSLAKFEEELGIKLFKRSRLGTEPTDRGKIILRKIDEILTLIEEIKEESQIQSALIEGEVRFSIGPNIVAILSQSIISFKRDHPNVRLAITGKNSEAIVQDLREDRTDLGLIYFDRHRQEDLKDLTLHKMLDSRIIVYVGKRSPLAGRVSVTPGDLLDQTFVNADNNYSNWFMQDFIGKYGSVNIIFTSNNVDILKRTIAENVAIGIFIELSMKNDPLVTGGDIVGIPLVDHEPNTVPLGWARLTNKHFSIAQREFLKYLIREYDNFK
ncbi:LysR family transcriptional regulator [Cohnella sp. LGH]|uniref:DNA-binding transcriptional LysR family regulator n=1 Tax=Cohnella phaseoli TaxID=456490 RepID=A0A3D9I4D7_9BACL|nr:MULTISPECIES: LysR family transcriptional regulator [Cohnella]QTH42469.1 LysR family transcriptional regulator [Cohnella sp. LGH]RED56652.1 DNA-binding transcriptional LysR family regulator [Cohnella phaseoli]